ncbi:hypothetical protein [Psychroserpens sp. S379A]|uniref:hypothetical protein n=1 Tax=Psychroserpens sp. S379A TaxID=3415137 RepID=UPI003C7A5483
MKKTKFSIYSTDYFFEWLYLKSKSFLSNNTALKLSAIKLVSIMAWFKDIN